MKKQDIQLITMIVSVIILGVSVKIFGLETTTVVTLGLLISKIILTTTTVIV
jgi:hypothetical protein